MCFDTRSMNFRPQHTLHTIKYVCRNYLNVSGSHAAIGNRNDHNFHRCVLLFLSLNCNQILIFTLMRIPGLKINYLIKLVH